MRPAPCTIAAPHEFRKDAAHKMEREGGGAMTFDYVLRPGVATSRNALRLMELMGLRDGGR